MPLTQQHFFVVCEVAYLLDVYAYDCLTYAISFDGLRSVVCDVFEQINNLIPLYYVYCQKYVSQLPLRT